MLLSRKLLDDVDLDSYLVSLDFEVCSYIEKWRSENTPTATMRRIIDTTAQYFHISWYIEFDNKSDFTLYQLSRQD